jgi:hypothetical protein
MAWPASLTVPFFLVLGVAVAAGATGTTTPSPSPVTSGCGTVAVQAGKPADGTGLDSVQLANAQVV